MDNFGKPLENWVFSNLKNLTVIFRLVYYVLAQAIEKFHDESFGHFMSSFVPLGQIMGSAGEPKRLGSDPNGHIMGSFPATI